MTAYPITHKDTNGNITFHAKSAGVWFRSQYDEHHNRTYFEDCTGNWTATTFDKNGAIETQVNNKDIMH